MDDLTGLVSPRRIVYCEGKAETRLGEEKGVDSQVYNNIFGETYSDTLFVSSGGGGEPAQRSSIAIDILGKALVDVNISVLLDRDFASGKTTTQTDRDIYLKNNPKKHRVLRRWELENYLYDKEVLRQYSKQYDLEFDEDTFDDKIANIVDGDVRGLTGLIKNICGVKGNVSPKNFKIELSKLITPEMEVYKELESCIFY